MTIAYGGDARLATAIAVDATSIYWVNGSADQGAVMKAPLAGGPAVALATGQQGPDCIAVDATSVYWGNYGSSSQGTVAKVALGGGVVTTLAAQQGAPVGIAVGGGQVFFTSLDWNSVLSVPVGGGAVATIASGQNAPLGIAVDSTRVYWTNQGSYLGNDGSVTSAPLAGGKPFVTPDGRSDGDIAVDATSIYWLANTMAGNGSLSRVPLEGGLIRSLVSTQVRLKGLAVDGTNVYFGEDDAAGAVMKVPVTGGTPTTLAAAQHVTSIAVDATSVYWTETGADGKGGDVKRLTPK